MVHLDNNSCVWFPWRIWHLITIQEELVDLASCVVRCNIDRSIWVH